jgi:cyclopropane-fatty-acyl-phospholipid synthase
MQLARKRDAAPIVRDYITDVQREYKTREPEGLTVLKDAGAVTPYSFTDPVASKDTGRPSAAAR